MNPLTNVTAIWRQNKQIFLCFGAEITTSWWRFHTLSGVSATRQTNNFLKWKTRFLNIVWIDKGAMLYANFLSYFFFFFNLVSVSIWSSNKGGCLHLCSSRWKARRREIHLNVRRLKNELGALPLPVNSSKSEQNYESGQISHSARHFIKAWIKCCHGFIICFITGSSGSACFVWKDQSCQKQSNRLLFSDDWIWTQSPKTWPVRLSHN